MHASSFYPALTTHVQHAVDQHGEFAHLPDFISCLAECQANITTAIQATADPITDADVCYRIHQAAAVCIKALTGFNMAPRNARPPAALTEPTPPPTETATPPTTPA
jgi:hypothetical protein